ncbi:MAG: leucine--tRNA ligase [Saprospiraceae bacterium]|nr:leucine--tRNA ligase [Saprospiraceae bacterium]
MEYNPREIERKWQQRWKDLKSYQVSNQSDRPKYFVLDMFPYPSGAGLHVGHPLGYIASDIYSRYKRLNGFNVLHPMGYDAFGLPAEQYAIQTGVHPADSTVTNVERYRKQLDNLGFCFDWDRQVSTCDPTYYKWTQWIFLQLFDHYYDLDANKALPISALIKHFEENGNLKINAHNNQENTFTAAEWSSFSPKMKDDVLMNYRLAYRKTSYVWWCEALGTVLANDEVKDGVSERGGHPVVKKAMLQWSLRITAYAERLLNDLDTLDWSDAMKAMQKNWIGKSEGTTVFFDIENHDQKLEIFTTRPDTIFGATFMVMAPEHPLVQEITTSSEKENIQKYLNYVQTRSDRDRMSESKTVTGAFTGAYCVHPFSGNKIPIWIAEYVLLDYGTGAIMAVPSDDERDNAFAKKFGLDIIEVVDKSDFPNASLQDKVGKMINSDFLNGKSVKEAIGLAIQKIDESGLGKRRVNYKLRDANFSRQRYWGEPFPITYDKDGVAYADPNLPLELPDLDDFKPASGAQSPLSRVKEWVELKNGHTRDTDTMPGFAGSSWYYLRYMDANNDDEFASKQALDYWKQVDLYIGGTEHAVGHLMYSRCWHKFLYDLGKVPTIEPYLRLVNQGMIQGRSLFIHIKKGDGGTRKLHIQIQFADDKDRLFKKDYLEIIKNDNRFEGIDIDNEIDWVTDDKGEQFTQLTYEVEKMSKSKYNVVNPDDVVEEYGADCFRMYEMFLGPIEQSKPWDTKSIDGVSRFLRRFWSLYVVDNQLVDFSKDAPSKAELKILHTCIKKVREDIEKLSFNTCVSAMMICCNDLKSINCKNHEILSQFALLISPFAPHISEELWELMGNTTSNLEAAYPVVNEAYLEEDAFTYTVAINGKRRGEATFPANATPSEVEKAALAMEVVQKWVEGNEIKKVIVVPKKMVNIVL